MRKLTPMILTLLLVLSSAVAAYAPATAYWTGRSYRTQTVTYVWVWNCEYNYNGRKFWRAFESNCPSSVEVY